MTCTAGLNIIALNTYRAFEYHCSVRDHSSLFSLTMPYFHKCDMPLGSVSKRRAGKKAEAANQLLQDGDDATQPKPLEAM